ncbi:MAG: hypothetical protein IGS48_02440 [Oscillatoriales cyanobacterium C42_A2020_001]|nr:hypothetical protein [Leptolyngbyaceae cyanobacterium C42_A2020_001]
MLSNSLSPLILPGDPEFAWTLGNYLPPTPQRTEVVYIQRPGSSILEPATPEEAYEYCHSGEYDERLAEIPDNDDDEWTLEDYLTLETH